MLVRPFISMTLCKFKKKKHSFKTFVACEGYSSECYDEERRLVNLDVNSGHPHGHHIKTVIPIFF